MRPPEVGPNLALGPVAARTTAALSDELHPRVGAECSQHENRDERGAGGDQNPLHCTGTQGSGQLGTSG